MKTGFSVSFFHGLTSLPCPGVCRHCSFHADSDPHVGSLPVFEIQCLLHVASSVLFCVTTIGFWPFSRTEDEWPDQLSRVWGDAKL